jgi:hypothetical protein
VEGNKIIEVRATEPIRVPLREAIPEYSEEAITELTEVDGQAPTTPYFQRPFEITAGPSFHDDERIDVAVFKVASVHAGMACVPLGQHLDDWIARHEWRLSEAIVLGYPPIPLVADVELIAARAEINGVCWLRDSKTPAFLLSATPRGGFSGGLALHEMGFALGVVTHSLVNNGLPAELGYLTVVSVESIYVCLAKHKLLPDAQKEQWAPADDIWNTRSGVGFVAKGGKVIASVSIYDDGKRVYLNVRAHDPNLLEVGVASAMQVIDGAPHQREIIRDDRVRIHLKSNYPEALQLVQAAAKAVERKFSSTGAKQIGSILPDIEG